MHQRTEPPPTSTSPPPRLVTAGVVDHNPPSKKKLNKPNKCYIATLNVRSLLSSERLIQLEHALSEIKWSIIGISEVRRQGWNIEDKGKYVIYYYGETKGERGIGFLVKKSNNIQVQDFLPISERVALIKVKLNEQLFTIIEAYAPTERAEWNDIEIFYNSLQEAIEKSTKNIVLMGDMNAKIGQTTDDESRVLGKYGYGERNERGELFIDFCQQHELKIMNTMFNKPGSKRWTWKSPNGTTLNEIDFITTNVPRMIANVSTLNSVAEAKVLNGKRNNNIITEEIKELINKRHNLACKQKKTKQEKDMLSKLYRELNDKIRTNEQNHRLETLERERNSCTVDNI
ncbi:craniofacial development protein 2-like [Maniola hyperantus]|uniref:craniofacial development protein 2-like n=1 Tax=Aphantopus hyperantus TaxID=2795564 RepID=UPI00374A709F